MSNEPTTEAGLAPEWLSEAVTKTGEQVMGIYRPGASELFADALWRNGVEAALAASRAETAAALQIAQVNHGLFKSAEDDYDRSRAETAVAVAALERLLSRSSLRWTDTNPHNGATLVYHGTVEHPLEAICATCEAWLNAERTLTDLTAAAQAHDADVARAAVEPWREALEKITQGKDQPFVAFTNTGTANFRNHTYEKHPAEVQQTEGWAEARALLAQTERT